MWSRSAASLRTLTIEKLRAGMFLPPDRTPLKTREGQLNAKAAPRRSKAVKTGPARIKLVRDADNPWYEITLIEGRNRQIRRMFKQIGHDVEKIRRVRYGPLEFDVEPGKFRHLTAQEVARLKSATTCDQSILASPASTPAPSSRQKQETPALDCSRRHVICDHCRAVSVCEKPSSRGRRAAPYSPASLPSSARVTIVPLS